MLRLLTTAALALAVGGWPAAARADDPPSQKEINATNYRDVASVCRLNALNNWNKADAAFKNLELVTTDMEADLFANQKAIEDGCTPTEWATLNKNLAWCYEHRDKGAGSYVKGMDAWLVADADWTGGMGAFVNGEWDTAWDWFVAAELWGNGAAWDFDNAEEEWEAALGHAQTAYAIIAKYRVRATTRDVPPR